MNFLVFHPCRWPKGLGQPVRHLIEKFRCPHCHQIKMPEITSWTAFLAHTPTYKPWGLVLTPCWQWAGHLLKCWTNLINGSESGYTTGILVVGLVKQRWFVCNQKYWVTLNIKGWNLQLTSQVNHPNRFNHNSKSFLMKGFHLLGSLSTFLCTCTMCYRMPPMTWLNRCVPWSSWAVTCLGISILMLWG